MDVLGYNIAHANDPTYKRQRIIMSEGSVFASSQEATAVGSSVFGSGVTSGDVERVRDILIENRLRQSYESAAEWSYKSSTLNQVQTNLGEPSDSGLQADLDQFWASWQKVATTPNSMPIRSALIEDSSALCQRIQFVYNQMGNTVQDLDQSNIERVDKVNQISDEIARLSSQIGALESGQMPVNDLLNRRDALVGELSKLVSVTVHGDSTNNFVISIGGRILVQGMHANKLTTTIDAHNNHVTAWADDGAPVVMGSGEMQAIADLRDNVIPDYMSKLDDIATSLVSTVNALHHTGMIDTTTNGGDFFKAGTTAANISLDPSIIDHPELVAASTSGAQSDGSIAQKIASLKVQQLPSGKTINQMYVDLVGEIGVAAATADRQTQAHQLSVDQFTTQEQSVSGVSLDEEMTNMIKFQQAYNASARLITVMDEMLKTLMQTGSIGG